MEQKGLAPLTPGLKTVGGSNAALGMLAVVKPQR